MTQLQTRIAAEPNAWIDVDLAALTANAQLLTAHLAGDGNGPQVMAVVKADGYGHGAPQAAKAFTAGGIRRFAVTTLDEALTLVNGGVDPRETPILVFAPLVTAAQAELAATLGLEITLCDTHHIHLAYDAAIATENTVAVHLKVDTGMGRLGESTGVADGIARLIAACDRLSLVGTYTHFANATEDSPIATRRQLSAFNSFCETLLGDGISPGLRHAANSASALRFPESRLDMVRLGTVLYGQYPSSAVPRIEGLNAKTWQARARVVFVRKLPTGAHVGYGSETTVKHPTRTAVVAVGFADGFAVAPMSLYQGKRGVEALVKRAIGRDAPHVYVNGQIAPVLGRVAMQMIVVDTTDVTGEVHEGDVVDVPMRRITSSARLARVYHG
jgi:alanine racemase